MKIKKILCLGLLAALPLVGCGGGNGGGEQPATDLKGEYSLKVWVGEGTETLTSQLIRDFEAANEGITIKETIEPVSEANAATQVTQDIDAAADIYSFAQDQFATLVQAGALAKLGDAAAKAVKDNNDAGSVGAVTSGDKLFGYPMTSDNGYFMYYDKSVITNEEHLKDVAALVADCEAAGKKFAFETETSGWYLAAWFFGAGCVSEWTTNADGEFVSVNDDFNSAKGVIAAKGMQQLVKSTAHLSSSETSALSAAIPAAILVSGTWAYEDVKTVLGDNMGVAELPSFTVEGQTYHLGSFSGNKLLGVKPSSDVKKQAVCHKLAEFLTNEQSQLKRFEAKSWGPSNLNAKNNEAVLANPALAALAKQNNYAVPQGQIPGGWWNSTKVLGAAIRNAEDDAAINAALAAYATSNQEALNA